MAPDSAPLIFPHDDAPAGGTTIEVAPGIHWLRMPLPFALDHATRELWARHFDARHETRAASTVLNAHARRFRTMSAGRALRRTGANCGWGRKLARRCRSTPNHITATDHFYRAHGRTGCAVFAIAASLPHRNCRRIGRQALSAGASGRC
jgi:hypothetical protein